ncbi:ROK family transcriptional regulator [Rhizobium miluonense]|uniref:Sugar kinase of the NBD/HSP70 family, may contain an N-terminal HTH domain n=1 Tax=Rhizobium miluonense TaxID=411945 RepID=A0A1C3WTC8_9HYPH|nr:ROK family transcriptional regulator [Rhizobium miluonense]SCB43165.1 Sugar kinase of the NBD/HSP70 family, may contain an N-terminal HTH domain [Rhizobium miluonense]
MNDIRPIRATSGTNHEGTSAHNRRVIIDALRLNGALSRADLARATRLTKQTVSNIMEELENDGLVISRETVRRGRGQPSTPYGLVPEGAFAIGLQIDRHITRAIAVDLVGNVLIRKEANLPAGGPATGTPVVLQLVESVRSELKQRTAQAEKRLVGLGVAMPGPFGIEQDTDDNPWMMGPWQRFPLLETLAAGTGLNVTLQNDAAACATAERMVGAAHGLDHAVCLYVGYGIGAGLILGGELYSGARGNAGEIGMALLTAGGRLTQLEHRASLASLYEHLGVDPMAPDIYSLIDKRSAADDPEIVAWIEKAAIDLRWAVHLIETVFDPQTVILCGGAPAALATRLIDAMQPLLPSNADRTDRPLPRLQLGMTDPWAVARGAAVEPIGHAFDPRFSAILKS